MNPFLAELKSIVEDTLGAISKTQGKLDNPNYSIQSAIGSLGLEEEIRMKIYSPGAYNARDLDLKCCENIVSRLASAFSRMQKRKDSPVWLLLELDEIREMASYLVPELRRRRDEYVTEKEARGEE